MELKTIKVSDCYEFPTNPRGAKFEGKEFDELVASVKEKGVLMPVLARPNGKRFEIVAGNRRLRAAKEAGLAEIPARIADMTDIEAREAQIVENLQRADIHPIDEAAAYRDLIENSKPRPEIATIAAKVGKSESYVRQRLVLTQLDAKIAAKVRAGQLSIAHAVLVARLDKAEQPAAYKFATERGCTLSELREHIAETVFRTAMKNPPWKSDEQAKAEIAKVTGLKGGDTNLFGEEAIEKIENPADYARAMAAYIQLKIDEFKSAGKPLTLASGDYSTTLKGVLGRNEYHTMDQAWYGNKKCKSGHDALIVDGDGVGKLIKICTDKKCPAHNYSAASETPEAKAEARTERKKERVAADRKRTKDAAAMTAAVAKMSWPLTEKHLDVLIGIALPEASFDTQKQIVKRRELNPDKKRASFGGYDYERPIQKAAADMTPKEKVGLLLELLVPCYSSYYNERRASAFKRL